MKSGRKGLFGGDKSTPSTPTTPGGVMAGLPSSPTNASDDTPPTPTLSLPPGASPEREGSLPKRSKSGIGLTFSLTRMLKNQRSKTSSSAAATPVAAAQTPTASPTVSFASTGPFADSTIFGIHLSSHRLLVDEVPQFVVRCVRFILDSNLIKAEGVFRISSTATEVRALRLAFDRGDDPDLYSLRNPHSVAVLFKQFLRELPEPVCTFDMYTTLMKGGANTLKAETRQQTDARITKAVAELPPIHRTLLIYVIRFLQDVCANSATNKMDTSNVAKLFAPNIFRNEGDADFENTRTAYTYVQYMVEDYEAIFGSFPPPKYPPSSDNDDSSVGDGSESISETASTGTPEPVDGRGSIQSSPVLRSRDIGRSQSAGQVIDDGSLAAARAVTVPLTATQQLRGANRLAVPSAPGALSATASSSVEDLVQPPPSSTSSPAPAAAAVAASSAAAFSPSAASVEGLGSTSTGSLPTMRELSAPVPGTKKKRRSTNLRELRSALDDAVESGEIEGEAAKVLEGIVGGEDGASSSAAGAAGAAKRKVPRKRKEKSRVIALTEDSPSEQLLDACRQGDYDEALRLITSSNPSTPSSVVDINVMDSRRWTPLFYAANRQDKRLLTLLVESRADVTRTNARGETALHRAAIVGSVPCVNTLVLCGASVDAADGHGFTPLLAAAFAGQLAIVEWFLDKGLSVDHADVQTQKTALHLAAFQGHLPVVQVLLDRGAKIDAVDAFGWTPLMFAAHAGHFDVASALVAAKANITLETPKGQTATSLADAGGYFNISAILIVPAAAKAKKSHRVSRRVDLLFDTSKPSTPDTLSPPTPSDGTSSV